jgi:hypothetical protein
VVHLALLASLVLAPSPAAAEPAAADPATSATEPSVPNQTRPTDGPTAVTMTEGDAEVAPPSEPTVTDAPISTSATTTTTVDMTAGELDSDDGEKRLGLQRHRFVYKNLTAARFNPLGLANEFQFGWRLQLVNKNTTLFKESFMALKAHTFLNPAFGRVGPMFELQPIALLNLHAIYNAVGYFKSFDQFQSFQSPAAVYSDTELEKRTEQRYPAMGHMVTLSALLQAKVGRVAVRDNVKGFYTKFDVKSDPRTGRDDTVYYDQTLDILQPNDGWVLTNDADALYLFDFGLKLGARYTYTKAFYRDEMYLPGESTRDRNQTQRVGPAILYSPPKWRAKAARRTGLSRKRWYNPTAFLLAQWWVQHRWRTGQDVSQGVPYIVLGFTFEGDFHP